MKTLYAKLFTITLIIVMVAGGIAFGQTERVSLATAGTGGAWYPIGAGIANLVTEQVPGVIMSAEVTNGGVENIRLIDRNEVQFAFANYDVAYAGVHGEEPYSNEMQVAGLFTLYPSSFQVAVPADSGIESIADLKGKRVVVGPPASSSAILGWNVLQEYGISPNDIRALTVSFSEGADLMRDGNADALFVMSAHPNSALLNLETSVPIRLIDIEEDMLEQIVDKYKYYGRITIPAGTYNQQDQPVETLALSTMLVANPDISDELAYQVTKAIFENLDQVRGFHAVARDVSLEHAPSIPIPMHPGARRYFEEQGLVD